VRDQPSSVGLSRGRTTKSTIDESSGKIVVRFFLTQRYDDITSLVRSLFFPLKFNQNTIFPTVHVAVTNFLKKKKKSMEPAPCN
jgi:hypothetical protein